MHPYLIPALELSPIAIDRLVSQVPAHRHDEATDPGRFTLREAIAHLADWEPIFVQRIQQGMEIDGSEVAGIDEGDRAEELQYQAWGVADSLAKFKAARAKTIAFIKSLTPAQLASTIRHSEKGIMTAEDQINMLVGHDMYHIEHLTQYLCPKTASTW